MKNKKIKSVTGLLIAFFIGQNILAASKDDLYSQIPPVCPSLQSAIQKLRVSDISEDYHHSYHIQLTDSYDTKFRWNFKMEDIKAKSKKEALSNALKILNTSGAPLREATFYSIQHILEVECTDEDKNYKFVHRANCESDNGIYTHNYTCTSLD